MSAPDMLKRNANIPNMFNLRPFQIYFTVFYILGINPFVSFTDVHKKHSKFILFLPRMLNLSALSIIIYKFCEQLNYSTFLLIYARFVLISVICVNSVAIVEKLYNWRSTRHILETMSLTIDHLDTFLQIKYPFESFKKSIERKLLFQIMVILVTSTMKHYADSIGGTGWKNSVYWAITNSIQTVTVFHLTFFMDFIECVLVSLNRRVAMKMMNRNINWCHGESEELLYVVRQIKLVYFKLCRMSQCVNCLFGWFSIAYVIQTVSSAVYNVFWAFSIADQPDVQLVLIIRKYCSENILYKTFYRRFYLPWIILRKKLELPVITTKVKFWKSSNIQFYFEFFGSKACHLFDKFQGK